MNLCHYTVVICLIYKIVVALHVYKYLHDFQIQLCQLVIKQTESVKSKVTQTGESGIFLLKHLLLLCLK